MTKQKIILILSILFSFSTWALKVLADTSGFSNQKYDNAEHVISVSTMCGQQVVDITGRQFSSVRLDGTLSADRASLGILRSGVYLLRLLGNDMKTQKNVVK